jgi:hypothetical protein
LDIADLFGASYHTVSVEATDLHTFEAIIFDNYLAGLHDAGWQGDPRLARFGFAASASLKYGSVLLILWLGEAAGEERRAFWEALSGLPFDAFLQHQAPLITYLLDLADEAHTLLAVI